MENRNRICDTPENLLALPHTSEEGCGRAANLKRWFQALTTVSQLLCFSDYPPHFFSDQTLYHGDITFWSITDSLWGILHF